MPCRGHRVVHAAGRAGLREVLDDDDRLRQLGRELLEQALAARDQHEPRAAVGELAREHRADAHRRTRDQYRLTGEIEVLHAASIRTNALLEERASMAT